MNEYKVIFENNIPVFARRMDVVENKDLIKLSREGDKRFMNWLVVYGDSEADAIDIAQKVIKAIWSEYLS